MLRTRRIRGGRKIRSRLIGGAGCEGVETPMRCAGCCQNSGARENGCTGLASADSAAGLASPIKARSSQLFATRSSTPFP